MKWVSSAEQVRALDQGVIDTLGVPGIALMEVASRAVAMVVRERFLAEARQGVVVACGPGNNGGDGYGVARWLHGWGLPVQTLAVRATSTGDAQTMREACARLGIPEAEGLGGCGLIVDALLGTGVTRKLRDPVRTMIGDIEQHPAPVVSVDLPSGVHCDTGQPMGAWLRAEHTVTFGRIKPALLLDPGAGLAGTVTVADIGLGAMVGDDPQAIAEIPEACDLAGLVPRRDRGAYKRSSGHLLVVAGSTAMAGAAVLACRGALAAGAGLVTLCTPRGAVGRLGALPPEVMVRVGGDGDVLRADPGLDLSLYDAVVAGPGLGGGQPLEAGLRSWLERLWERDGRPLLYDADALRAATSAAAGPRVITPHAGEAAAMLDMAAAGVQRNRLSVAARLAKRAVTVLKGPNTIVAARRKRLSFNPTGNPVLASGGTGDVLSGVIGALLARGMGARDAARVGVWVHGEAADGLASERREGWTASDVAAGIPEALERLRSA